jgi:putative transposase
VTKYAFVSAERANHAVATLGRVVGVSVSGFYAWLCGPAPLLRTPQIG